MSSPGSSMQQNLLPIRILSEVDATEFGLDGKDLKRLAKCDDGHTYAMKRVQDHPLLPLCEWVGYHLCRACGVLTPDFSILTPYDGAPSFGSRIASYSQIEHQPGAGRVVNFFHGQEASLSRVYALDAFLINPDRHGRNLFLRTDAGGTSLLAFDFSRAWLRTGNPFGNDEALRGSSTQDWWQMFKRMKAALDQGTISRIETLGNGWLGSVIQAAPLEWRVSIDEVEVVDYWTNHRKRRLRWAELWLA